MLIKLAGEQTNKLCRCGRVVARARAAKQPRRYPLLLMHGGEVASSVPLQQ
jgi:hypothetical protein